jgi:hypothetical protein
MLDSVRWAAEEARGSLASSLLGVNLRDVQVIGNETYEEVSLEQVKGVLADIVIVAQWIDRGGAASDPGTSYAVACTRAASASFPSPSGAPPWVLNVPSDRVCALGVCGPTIRPEDQQAYVVDDARERLAESIAIHLEAARSFGVPGIAAASLETVPDDAVERAKAGSVRETWLDLQGLGPLQEPGAMYALICVD